MARCSTIIAQPDKCDIKFLSRRVNNLLKLYTKEILLTTRMYIYSYSTIPSILQSVERNIHIIIACWDNERHKYVADSQCVCASTKYSVPDHQ